jgi:hypothetical protein
MYYNSERDYYDIAEICHNGHVSNDSTQKYPEDSQKFCDVCGQKTIRNCEKCNEGIRGFHHIAGIGGGHYTRPSFCINCGEAFPWTSNGVSAAKEFTEFLDEISSEDKDILIKSLDDLVKDSPRTPLAAAKFKKIVSKAGSTIAGSFKDILVDVISETAKKAIWPS